MKNEQKQKRIIVLSVLAVMVYLFLIVSSFSAGWDSFQMGYWAAQSEQESNWNQPKIPGEVYYLNIKPREGFQHFPGQIPNLRTDAVYSARYSQMQVAVPSGEEIPSMVKYLNWLKTALMFISFILYIIIPFVFIKLISSLYTGNVFDLKNLRDTRILGIILILLYCSIQGVNYSSYRIHLAIFSLEDYRHVFNFTQNYLLMMGVALLLTAEILSRGLMLKEEQDLTV